MATLSESPITRRVATLQRRSPLERYGYLFMRLTGVALLLLAVGHMMIQHVLNDVHNLTLAFVQAQWSSWGWRAYDLLLLIFAISHGFNGLRTVLEDYVHNERTVRVLRWALFVFLVITIFWAAVAIISFDASVVS
jgi:succinate dehydrogenase / fumarate reductase membrane anchor subunit